MRSELEMGRRVNIEVSPKRLSRRNIRSHHQNKRGCQKVKKRCVKERWVKERWVKERWVKVSWVKERWVKADSDCIEQNIQFLLHCQMDRRY